MPDETDRAIDTPALSKPRRPDIGAVVGSLAVAAVTIAIAVMSIVIDSRLDAIAHLARDTWVVDWASFSEGTLVASDLRRLPGAIGAPMVTIQLGGLLAILAQASTRRARRTGAATLLLMAFGAAAAMLFAIIGLAFRRHVETSELVREGALIARIDPASGLAYQVFIADEWTSAYPDGLARTASVLCLVAVGLVALSTFTAIRSRASTQVARDDGVEVPTDGPLASSRGTAALSAVAAVCTVLPEAIVGIRGMPFGDRPYVSWPVATGAGVLLYLGIEGASSASQILRIARKRSVALVTAAGATALMTLAALLYWRTLPSFGGGVPVAALAAVVVPAVVGLVLYLWVIFYYRSYAIPVQDALDEAEEQLSQRALGGLAEAARVLESMRSHASRYRGRLYLKYAITYLNTRLLLYESSGRPEHLDDALGLVHGESGLYELLIRSGQRGWGDARASSYWLQKVLTYVAYTLGHAYSYTMSTGYLVDAIKVLSHLSHRRGLHHWLDRIETNHMLAVCLAMMHQADPSWDYRTTLAAQDPAWPKVPGTSSLLEIALELSGEPSEFDVDPDVAPTNLLSAAGFVELLAWLESGDSEFLQRAIAKYERAETEDQIYMSALTHREIADLERADLDPIMRIGERMLEQDRNHHARSLILAEIGNAGWFKYLHTTNPADLGHARTCFEAAWNQPDVPLYGRLNAAARWAYLTAAWADDDDLPLGIDRVELRRESLRAFEAAARLLPSVTLLSGYGSSRGGLVAQDSDFAGAAVAVAIDLGEIERAVELYELGRLVTQERLVLPGLLAGEDSFDRATADELQRIRDRLTTVEARGDLLHTTAGLFASLRYRAQHRVRYTRELAEAIAAAAGDPPALGDFDDLSRAAAGGPIVLFNSTELRVDALILTPGGGLRHVRLPPEVTASRITGITAELDRALGERPGHASPEFMEDLNRWLWDNVVGPVVAEVDLGYSSRRGRVRLWLCPDGQLGRLPLHTATSTYGQRLIDMAVPVYTTSLRTLLGLRRSRPPSRRVMRAGFLGVSDKPWAAGPGVAGLTSERLVAEQYLPGIEVRLEADANSRSFAELLRDRHWLHLACHGTTGTGSARAGVVLSDRVVRAEEILRYRDVATAYAFLPICGGARADPELADEALHAAGALYRAGVRNVVGTLWEVYDHRDPRMSKVHRMVRELYVALAAQPSSVPPDMPLAYRDAVAKLIRVAPADLPHWSAFVCMAA